jgi:lipoprotein NlpD
VARDERGLYTVKKGDTLIRIALEFGQNYRDLVAWNNLSNPNDIKVDQVLRVLPPESNGVETAAVVMPPSDKTAAAAGGEENRPKGDKKPYSEANLAEMQRADNGKDAARRAPAATARAPCRRRAAGQPPALAPTTPA